ncbi:MAG TPA: amidohydrolase family protein [Burkholderiales bacterium]|nr:amidohydrolase family protein [Burkholderiales bacterium]
MTKPIPGPDPGPVKPKYVPPPGACDAHCHIFGPAAKFPYAPSRRYTPPDAPKEKLRALHQHLGLSRAVLVQASCHGDDNRAMLDAIAWSGSAWRGVAMVGDDVTDRELKALHDGGVRGVRFNFVRHLGGAPDPRVFERTLAMIEPLRWHVVLHFDAEDIETHAEVFRKLRVPFVIDHMGRVDAAHGLDQKPFAQLLELMKNPLAWVKVSGPERISATGKPFRDAVPFAAALGKAAPDRVLWGTDFPHPNVKAMPNDGELVDLFAQIFVDEALRKRILVDNPTRLYWA